MRTAALEQQLMKLGIVAINNTTPVPTSESPTPAPQKSGVSLSAAIAIVTAAVTATFLFVLVCRVLCARKSAADEALKNSVEASSLLRSDNATVKKSWCCNPFTWFSSSKQKASTPAVVIVTENGETADGQRTESNNNHSSVGDRNLSTTPQQL